MQGTLGYKEENIMSIKKIAVIASFALAIGLFVGGPNAPKAEAAGKPTKSKKVIVEVQPGDSLSKIANKKETTYQRIYYANEFIANPDIIHPGEKVRIPSKSEKLKKRTLPSAQVVAPKAVSTPAPTTPIQSATPSKQAIAASNNTVSNAGVWDRLASCESGGNWSINTGNGYYGGFQFSAATWRSVGGSGLPHQNSKAEQIKRAQILQARSGWGQWPGCSSMLGLR